MVESTDLNQGAARGVDQGRRKGGRPNPSGPKKVIYAAIAANVGIAISKFIVAGVTGSSAMLVEGIHSTVDTGNELLLMLGTKRSNRPADEWHPFGYGKVLYFWALIVALSVFSMGGGISIYHGVIALRDPPQLGDPTWNYVVLLVAAVFESYSWNVSRRELNRRRRPDESLWQAMLRSKDASVYTVFIEDSAALVAVAVALLGIWLGQTFANRYCDPAASVVIGVILVVAAFVLARETGGLLVGESIDRDQIIHLEKMISSDASVEAVGHLLTMQLGPEKVFLAAAVRFKRGLDIEHVEKAIERLEQAIKTQYPSVCQIFFESASIRSSFRPV
ncbi:MAG: cation diffusion facilitator family transporter [Herminiimonas sp.]|nr:cation diffusion facilitator family transporter [Herminiimonas sp.]MDB5855345.1 cation diffusion facilitator family transporter [Herminiimonas sp.]